MAPGAGLLRGVHSSGSCPTLAMTVVTTLRTAPASGGVPSRPANSRCPAPISVGASVSTPASAGMRPSSRFTMHYTTVAVTAERTVPPDPASEALERDLLTGLNSDGQPVLGRRQRAGSEVGVGTGQVHRPVEVDRHLALAVGC